MPRLTHSSSLEIHHRDVAVGVGVRGDVQLRSTNNRGDSSIRSLSVIPGDGGRITSISGMSLSRRPSVASASAVARGGGRQGRGRGGRNPSSTSSVGSFSNRGSAASAVARGGGRQGRGRGGRNPSSTSSVGRGPTSVDPGVIDPKNWAKSISKAFLRKELLNQDSSYWLMTGRAAYESRPDLFSPFKYTNFATNFRNLKNSIKDEVKAISFDDEAVQKEHASFPRPEFDSRGNKIFHTHRAKMLLAMDIKNGAGEEFINRPGVLRQKRNEYMEFAQKYFQKAFNRQKQREKEVVGWQHRRNLKGARQRLQQAQESNAAKDIE